MMIALGISIGFLLAAYAAPLIINRLQFGRWWPL
jgi:hypothetical protein